MPKSSSMPLSTRRSTSIRTMVLNSVSCTARSLVNTWRKRFSALETSLAWTFRKSRGRTSQNLCNSEAPQNLSTLLVLSSTRFLSGHRFFKEKPSMRASTMSICNLPYALPRLSSRSSSSMPGSSSSSSSAAHRVATKAVSLPVRPSCMAFIFTGPLSVIRSIWGSLHVIRTNFWHFGQQVSMAASLIRPSSRPRFSALSAPKSVIYVRSKSRAQLGAPYDVIHLAVSLHWLAGQSNSVQGWSKPCSLKCLFRLEDTDFVDEEALKYCHTSFFQLGPSSPCPT
mmetsp:Transcript_20850/g.62406  ORF Transcript_20850/g.62406 Transcript_20850/m.62406 type:complete len:283 (+) Transcript_20850:800-1648(+)